MAGTKIGGILSAKKNKEKYGKDFFSIIGAIGGKRGRTGGFASEIMGSDGLTGKERARIVGAEGGRKSKRTHGH